MKRDPVLNFDFIPDWTIPFRFFLTVPLFGAVAGAVLVLLGVDAYGVTVNPLWQSRWLSEVIYTLHLITLGVITMAMAGALFQVIAVVSGRLLPGGKSMAAVVHGGLVIGTLLFLVAMVSGVDGLYLGAAVSLVAALLTLCTGGLLAIHRARGNLPTLKAMQLSLISLLLMIVIGAALLLMHGYPEWLGFDRRWTDVHLVWALAGWVGLLIVGVSFQVIPMFHVTPAFDARLQKWLPGIIFCSIILLSITTFLDAAEYLSALVKGLLLACYTLYVVAVLRLISQRKRKIEDITVQFWKTAAFSFFLFILLQAGDALGVVEQWGEKISLLGGVSLVFGVILSVIAGMLQKIIPFLSYLHMQRFCKGDVTAIRALPHMRTILKTNHSRYFHRLHLLSLALLLLMVVVPELTLVAGTAVTIEFSLLLFIVARVVLMVRNAERQSLSVVHRQATSDY